MEIKKEIIFNIVKSEVEYLSEKDSKYVNEQENYDNTEDQDSNITSVCEVKKYYETFGVKKLLSERSYHKNGKIKTAKFYYKTNDKADKIKCVMKWDTDSKLTERKDYYLNGNLKKHRITDSFVAEYDEDGTLNLFEPLVNGVREGLGYRYNNGVLYDITPFVNGKIHGVYQQYWGNRNVMTSLSYVNGLAEGVAKTYYRDGTLESVAHYENNELNGDLIRYDYDTGEIIEITPYVNGKPHGVATEFDARGEIIVETLYENGEVIQEYF